MHIHLNAGDGVPIYLQIINQVKYLVASGRLAAGEELPPIRVLAERLLINPNTVARAYRDLERAGVVSKRSTTGTFVSAAGAALAPAGGLAPPGAPGGGPRARRRRDEPPHHRHLRLGGGLAAGPRRVPRRPRRPGGRPARRRPADERL